MRKSLIFLSLLIPQLSSAQAPFLTGGVGWHEMANTKLQTSQGVNVSPAVCPPNNFGGSGYGFTDGCASVWRKWNGGAIDDGNERLLIWGGGHSDYSGNELYALNYGQATPALIRLTNPTIPVSSSGSGFIPDGATCPQGSVSPTCRPNSRHTYGGIAVDPVRGNLVVHGGFTAPGATVEDLWWLPLSSCLTAVSGGSETSACSWTRKDSCSGGAFSGATGCGGVWPNQNTDQPYMEWDQVTMKFFVYYPNKCAYYTYDPATNLFALLDSGFCTSLGDMMSVIDPINRRYLMIGGASGAKAFSALMVSPYTITDITASLGATCVNDLGSNQAPGLAFDPIDKKVIGYSANFGNTIRVIDLSNNTCTSETYANGPPVNTDIQDHPIRGRFRYSAKEDAFIIHPNPLYNGWYLRRRAAPTSAYSDYLTRITAPGVVAWNGFDSSTEIGGCNPLNFLGSGRFVASDDQTTCPAIDAAMSRSGASSLNFTVKANGGSDSTGSWRQQFQSKLSSQEATSFKFSPPGAGGTNGTHFYVQFAQRMDNPFITNLYPATGGGSTYWKQEIIATMPSSCGGYELTTVNEFNNDWPAMYSSCGGQHLYLDIGPNSFHEQGDYNCNNSAPTQQTCFFYPTDTWVTWYYDINLLGAEGSATSQVHAFVAVNGQPYKQWININNFAQSHDTPNYYSTVYLFPYMTGRDSAQTRPVAHTWYDELIVSTQPILAPGTTQPQTSPAVSLSSATLSFGGQLVPSTSAVQTITLTNTGTGALTISSIVKSGANPSDFSISSNTCGASLAASANCIVGVTFNPIASGARSASIIFSTNAASSPDTVTLSGTGFFPVSGVGTISGSGTIVVQP